MNLLIGLCCERNPDLVPLTIRVNSFRSPDLSRVTVGDDCQHQIGWVFLMGTHVVLAGSNSTGIRIVTLSGSRSAVRDLLVDAGVVLTGVKSTGIRIVTVCIFHAAARNRHVDAAVVHTRVRSARMQVVTVSGSRAAVRDLRVDAVVVLAGVNSTGIRIITLFMDPNHYTLRESYSSPGSACCRRYCPHTSP
jgi:hypothetical protein